MNTNNGWLDIASAPKDGTEILVFHPEGGVCAAFCPGEGFAWHCMDGMNTVIGKKSRQSIPAMTSFTEPPTHWMPLPPAPTSHPIPTGATGNRDWELSCDECNGSGHVFVKHQVAERKTDVQEFKEECEECDGRGFNIAFEDIPGIEAYVKSCRPAPASAQDDAKDELVWRDGAPPFPQNQEWFIAETTRGDRIVLCALPEGLRHDYKTADDTYLKATLIKRWMQFPDCEYLPPAAPAAGDARALLDHPLLREVLGYIEDAGPADVWGAAQSWMALRDAASQQQEG